LQKIPTFSGGFRRGGALTAPTTASGMGTGIFKILPRHHTIAHPLKKKFNPIIATWPRNPAKTL
jgi:hypothetical protein